MIVWNFPDFLVVRRPGQPTESLKAFRNLGFINAHPRVGVCLYVWKRQLLLPSLQGRDARVVVVFGVADLASDLGTARAAHKRAREFVLCGFQRRQSYECRRQCT